MIGNETFTDELHSIRRELDELKGRQIIGADNTAIYTNRSDQAYDQSAIISGYRHIFVFTFEADRQDFALADLTVSVAIDNPATPATFYDIYDTNIYQLISDPDLPRQTKWQLELYNRTNGTHTFFVKATVMSVDSGSIL